MTNTLAGFNPESLRDAVRDRIRAEFVSLIPPDAWSALVKKEIDAFFEEKEGYPYQRNAPSDFRRTVHDVLEQYTRERLREMLADPMWAAEWTKRGSLAAGKGIRDMIRELMPEIAAVFIGGQIQAVVEGLRART